MKLITSLTLGLLTSTSLLAQTTMCFKENHTSMATIESTPLDGGLCSSTKSIQDMKKEGWSVDDIKITSSDKGNNYIYILKKEKISLSAMDEEKLEQRIMQRLETRKKEELEAKKRQIKQKMSRDGKKLYISTCQRCHGEKAELEAHNTSRPLISMNYDDMELSINGYDLDEYDRGRAVIMKPYANLIDSKDLKNIYSYIQTLKPQEEEKKEEESK